MYNIQDYQNQQLNPNHYGLILKTLSRPKTQIPCEFYNNNFHKTEFEIFRV